MATKATRVVLGPFFNSGVLETSIKVYTYEPGTTTNKTTWEDRDKATAEANPVVGDANGVATFFADGLYKFRIDDSDDNTLYTWDNYQVGQLTEDEKPHTPILFKRDTDTAHDIEIAILQVQDDGGSENMTLTAVLTKQIDAAWAVGDDAGGMDTGSVANNTWYYIWIIKRTDTNVVDALFSTDPTDPTMPTNYDKKRRIGAVLTDGSANILAITDY